MLLFFNFSAWSKTADLVFINYRFEAYNVKMVKSSLKENSWFPKKEDNLWISLSEQNTNPGKKRFNILQFSVMHAQPFIYEKIEYLPL